MQLQRKEALVEGILYRGDFVAVAGRRRHGKTTLMTQLGLSLTTDLVPLFIGYDVPQRRKVLLYLLEDTFRDSQRRLERMLDGTEDMGDTEGRLCIRTKNDFLQAGILIDIMNEAFRNAIEDDVARFRPDVIMFDHFGLLVAGEIKDTKVVHVLTDFATRLAAKHDCAVLVAAHPRKLSQGQRDVASLEKDRDLFFEELMGYSGFINATGSLWGIERKQDNYAVVYLGAQREGFDGELTVVEKGDDDWFAVADDFQANFANVMHTAKRKRAWELLPVTKFTAEEARNAVKEAISGNGSFYKWWNALKRAKLIIQIDERTFVKRTK